jgi:hypothetical protein
MSRPIVRTAGQRKALRSQKACKKGWIFSLAKFGCSARMPLISAITACGQSRRRRRFGAVDFGAKADGLDPFAFHENSVRRLTLKASTLAAKPWVCQNFSISRRSFASLWTISQRKAYLASR